MNGLDKLPEEIQKIIFLYAFKCKKNQNFYINKELCMLASNQLKDCRKIICLGKPICKQCDNVVLEWFFYMGCSVF